MAFESLEACAEALRDVAEKKGDRVDFDPTGLRDRVESFVRTAVFSKDPDAQDLAIASIRAAADPRPASIQGLYDAVARGEAGGFTVPAMNIRGMTFDVCRAVFRVAKRLDAGAFVFEIAKSEMSYTEQPPREYAACVLAAALAESWDGPVFIQGDHFQFKKPADVPAIVDLSRKAVAAGFFNLDVDASTLVDLSKPTVAEQQALNIQCQVDMTRAIREFQPKGVTISVGGEIGEVGKQNSTVDEFLAFAQGVRKDLGNVRSMSKVSVQTGTRHGGFVNPDGTVGEAAVDFEVHRAITQAARKFGLAGTVQHGASTLPVDLFHKFPETGCVEIHLATEFQNIMFDQLHDELRERIYAWVRRTLADEFDAKSTEAQNLYRTRKKAYGPFKRDLWNLPKEVHARVIGALETKFEQIFRQLKAPGTRAAVRKFVKPSPTAPAKPLLPHL